MRAGISMRSRNLSMPVTITSTCIRSARSRRISFVSMPRRFPRASRPTRNRPMVRRMDRNAKLDTAKVARATRRAHKSIRIDVRSLIVVNKPLAGKKIAILSTDGVEQSELTEPRKALEKAGAKTELVSSATSSKIQAMVHHEKGDKFPVDVELSSADPNDYDALVLPGGVANPDTLRTIPEAVNFV